MNKKSLSITIGLFLLCFPIMLSPESSAMAQGPRIERGRRHSLRTSALPAGATRVPRQDWTQEPIQGNLVQRNAWQQITGIWNCIQWEQLPPGADITCGYEDRFPTRQPVPPIYPGAVWICIEAPNVLIYTVPFNKGECMFASENNLPAGAFVPTEEQVTCADGERDEVIAHVNRLPPGTKTNYGFNRWKQQKRAELYGVQLALTSAATSVLLKAGSIPLTGIQESLVSEGLGGGIQGVANALQPAANFPTCADVASPNLVLSEVSSQANDDYHLITPPQPLPARTFSATGGLTQPEANAVNALLANQAQTIGYLRALGTALYKADLAAKAGESEWESRQIQAADQFSQQAGVLIESQLGLYAELAGAYTAAGHVYTIPIDEQDVRDFQSNLYTAVSQDQLRQSLDALGATPYEQDLFILSAYSVSSQDVVMLGGGKLPDIFIDPEFTEALQRAAEILQEGPIGSANSVYLPIILH